MKKFKIRCSYSNGVAITKFSIDIYDSNNCYVTTLSTNTGCVLFSPNNYGVYSIVVSTFNGCIYSTKLYLDDNTSCDIRLCFYVQNNRSELTFKLTDKFYPGLPIEKGELSLWNI